MDVDEKAAKWWKAIGSNDYQLPSTRLKGMIIMPKKLKQNRILKWINRIVSFFVIIILLYIAALLLFEQTPNITGIKHYTVVTNSMEPTINVGDLVFINERDDSYQSGDIIAFYQDINNDNVDEVVIHYIESIEGNTIATVSENGQTDPWRITHDDVIGTYMRHIAGVGNFLRFIQSPIGSLVIIIDVILVFVAFKIIWPKKK